MLGIAWGKGELPGEERGSLAVCCVGVSAGGFCRLPLSQATLLEALFEPVVGIWLVIEGVYFLVSALAVHLNGFGE